ncbi:MAG: flagellar basal-body rod protein FlgG [Pseudomonadota bacterium]
MSALDIAATGMLAQQLNVEVIANNIANLNTTAYKRQRPEFQDLLYQDLKLVGSSSSDNGTIDASGIQLGTGVKTGTVYRITSQGNMVSTENTLDLAIEGKGYFQIELPSGAIAYTRAGSLQLSPSREIVNADGFRVLPGITIASDVMQVTVNASGEVLVQVSGQTSPQNVGQLELATFPNEAGLQAVGGNLFLESASSGSPTTGTPGSTGFGTVLQGFLESSNVNMVTEITTLIAAQRAYEMNSKVIQTADEMMQAANQVT